MEKRRDVDKLKERLKMPEAVKDSEMVRILRAGASKTLQNAWALFPPTTIQKALDMGRNFDAINVQQLFGGDAIVQASTISMPDPGTIRKTVTETITRTKYLKRKTPDGGHEGGEEGEEEVEVTTTETPVDQEYIPPTPPSKNKPKTRTMPPAQVLASSVAPQISNEQFSVLLNAIRANAPQPYHQPYAFQQAQIVGPSAPLALPAPEPVQPNLLTYTAPPPRPSVAPPAVNHPPAQAPPAANQRSSQPPPAVAQPPQAQPPRNQQPRRDRIPELTPNQNAQQLLTRRSNAHPGPATMAQRSRERYHANQADVAYRKSHNLPVTDMPPPETNRCGKCAQYGHYLNDCDHNCGWWPRWSYQAKLPPVSLHQEQDNQKRAST